jgi:hypothetical protein
VKIRRLPETDLARIASLPYELRRKGLEQLRDAWPPFSLKPVRLSFEDIFDVGSSLIDSPGVTLWHRIEAKIKKSSNKPVEEEVNLQVAQALYSFAQERQVRGRRQEFFPLALGIGEKVTYWLRFYIFLEGQPFAVFIDPRRSRGLASKDARQFFFSMMHQGIRVADPDFAQIGLAIIQLDKDDDGTRIPRVHTDKGVELLSVETLESMISETYALWCEICEQRAPTARRSSGGGSGSLI